MIDTDLRADFDYELEQSAVNDFAKRNSRDCHLIGSWFHLNRKSAIVTSKQEKEIFDKGKKAWHYFYARYPHFQGILRLSRVGFIVCVENKAWWLAGRDYCGFVTKNKDRKWRIKKEVLAWMS